MVSGFHESAHTRSWDFRSAMIRSQADTVPVGPLSDTGAMGMIRRVVAALGLGAAVAAALRLKGSGGVPPQTGGWRNLSGPDQK